VTVGDRAAVAANFQSSQELQLQMWAIEQDVARSGNSSDLVASLGESLTDLRSLHES